MSLDPDIYRCLGTGCHLRTQCERYLDESYKGERHVVPAAVLCGKGGQVCPNLIQKSEDDTNENC